jgi:ubiquinone/menaquinone biosynthesis C-methylase UbiE
LSAGNRFDRTAERYAEHARRRDWSDFLGWCRPGPSDRALDVAGGPGMLSAALLPLVAHATVVDVAPALLAMAPEGVETVAARAEQLPFGPAEFDLVTCVMSLHHVARPPRVLDEMVRVLAPRGRIVLEDAIADNDPAIARRWEQIERLRDPEHMRLLEQGEARNHLVTAGMRVEAEETWLRTVDTARWIETAGVAEDVAPRIREMVGAPSFEQRMWRGRFRSPVRESGPGK